MKGVRLLLIGLATVFARELQAEVLTGPVTNAANGHWYFLLAPADWPSAETEAVNLGGHLATIDDADENAWVTNAFSNLGGVARPLWIGLNDSAQEDVWVWIGGEASPYRNWAPGEPNSGGGVFPDEDHVVMRAAADATLGMWNDAPSNQLQFAVVELVTPIPPSIVNQPQSRNAFVGEMVTLKVKVNGTIPFTYQWSLNGTNINGAIADSLILTNVQFADAGSYSVVVSNVIGSAPSSDAVLTVNPPPPCAPAPAGLISWWRADTNTLDSLGGNHGVLAGNTGYGQGRAGQGFTFDGNGDGVPVGNPASLRLQNFTIEAWIKRVSASIVSLSPNQNDSGLVAYGSGGYGLGLFGNGDLYLTKTSVDSVTVATGIADTDWHHVAVTKITNSVVFYVDGVAYPAPSYDSIFTFTTSLTVGANGSLAYSFLGSIDEVAIYDRALAEAEIKAIYNASVSGKCGGPAPVIFVQPADQTSFVNETVTFHVTALGRSPLAYQWQFNGTNILSATNADFVLFNTLFTNAGNYTVVVTNLYGSATSSSVVLTVNPARPCATPLSGLISWWRAESNGLDAVGNNNGNLVGNADFGAGQVGQGFAFDGDHDGLQIGRATNLWLQDFTIEAWIQRSSASLASLDPVGGQILSYGNGGYTFGILNDGTLHLSRTDVSSVTMTNGISDTNWHHVAVSKSGSTVVFHIDGVAYPVPAYGPVFTFGSSVAIGARGDNFGNSFLGTVDEISVYSRPLSTTEIQAIYTASSSGKCVVPVPPGIVSHPRNTNVTAGSSVTLTVLAGGSEPFSYQWRFNGTNIVNANGSTLTLTNVQFSQSGNYSAQVTNIAGSVLSSNASLTVTLPPAILQAANTNAISGGPVTVPIVLVANGNENSFGFSLNFNTSRLAYNRLTLGSSATGAALVVYTNQINLGRLGVVAAFPGSATFPAGTQEVIKVTFSSPVLLGSSSVATPVSFGDQPVLRQLSDAQFQTLPANYLSGAVTLFPTAYEGDIAPRPNGNQSYANADWLQAGRFAARLDVPAAGSEFQRADSAPRASLGDAQIKVTDWVQTGLYSLGLDPLTVAGGPTSEVALATTPVPGARQVRVVNASAVQGLTVTIPVNLEAQGDENAVGFTLVFDSAKFSYTGAGLGGAASGATLNLNTNQLSSGRLGVALALPIGSSFVAGTREIVRVNLTAKLFTAINSSVGFSDQLLSRAVSDPLANELPADYIAGNAIVNGAPPLSIVRSGSNLTLAWPTWAASFNLQSSSNLLSADTWTNVIATAQTNGPDLVVTLPIVEDTKFFRLQSP